MPCCGLAEFRVKVPTRLTLAGIALLTVTFTILFVAGVALCWRPVGRGILRCQKGFLTALWRESMRGEDTAFRRFGARASGWLLPRFPRAAAMVYRRPEVPLLAAVSAAIVGVIGVIGLAL